MPPPTIRPDRYGWKAEVSRTATSDRVTVTAKDVAEWISDIDRDVYGVVVLPHGIRLERVDLQAIADRLELVSAKRADLRVEASHGWQS